jgi:hypothetical protein
MPALTSNTARMTQYLLVGQELGLALATSASGTFSVIPVNLCGFSFYVQLCGEQSLLFFFGNGFIYLFIFVVLGLELRAFTLSHSTSPFFCWIFFEIGSH